MKKITEWIVIIILIIVLLLPRRNVLQDGGSIVYKTILYEVTQFHRLVINGERTEEEYIEGIRIKILGIEIYNDTEL